MSREYSTKQVAQRTGATIRQLQWWDEKEIIKPEIRGRRRYYSPDQVAEAQLLVKLFDKGVSLQKSRGVVDTLRKYRPSYDFLGVKTIYVLVNQDGCGRFDPFAQNTLETIIREPGPCVCIKLDL